MAANVMLVLKYPPLTYPANAKGSRIAKQWMKFYDLPIIT
jgi:hypothetical protein